jgi:hypothetical protein
MSGLGSRSDLPGKAFQVNVSHWESMLSSQHATKFEAIMTVVSITK